MSFVSSAMAAEPGMGTIPVDCEDIVTACDSALAAKNVQIEKLNLGLTESMNQSTVLTKDLNEANSKLESPFRNPYLMIGLGIIGGFAGGVYLMRK